MTIDEAIKEIKDASDSEVRYGDKEHHYNEVMKRVEAFDMAIKALEQEPCDDCISREAVSKLLNDGWRKGIYPRDAIMTLPSVTPKFTDAEIQKMQELEQAQLEKAYELGRAEMQPSEDCTSEEVTDIILSIARNLEHICEVIKNDKGRSNRHATNMDKKCR